MDRQQATGNTHEKPSTTEIHFDSQHSFIFVFFISVYFTATTTTCSRRCCCFLAEPTLLSVFRMHSQSSSSSSSGSSGSGSGSSSSGGVARPPSPPLHVMSPLTNMGTVPVPVSACLPKQRSGPTIALVQFVHCCHMLACIFSPAYDDVPLVQSTRQMLNKYAQLHQTDMRYVLSTLPGVCVSCDASPEWLPTFIRTTVEATIRTLTSYSNAPNEHRDAELLRSFISDTFAGVKRG